MSYALDESYLVEPTGDAALTTENLAVYYGGVHQALFDANLKFAPHTITALIGASGSGKSTFLRSLNRMNDKLAKVTGKIMYQGVDLNSAAANVYAVRSQLGMVFQRPNPFAKSIRANIEFALKAHGIKDKQHLAASVESSLKGAALWDEVKDVLDDSAMALSGGQQQRLCIARAIAMQPEILLLDEPASALDPLSTSKIEETLVELAKQFTIIIVTHNMQQATRISQYCAFFHLGHVMEYDQTDRLFTQPHLAITNDYVTGSFG
ncbi:phosphate ABC transporter ATP-binding protein PstB [Lacticaseibacillus baoqingensis]|jgi:phosphate transport system ATP-binding protein|uniref:Phosphate ABC transporter ATP-binding protein PstB n=1 Tax=Lacticaseibacillus baoqingensis TaxID=2486013 RepID=A0ABW4E7L7_9LACO|nr:phosphate ABC transporter ATP-binding protein PstB [Lacticaseibacillus baoqingensis]